MSGRKTPHPVHERCVGKSSVLDIELLAISGTITFFDLCERMGDLGLENVSLLKAVCGRIHWP